MEQQNNEVGKIISGEEFHLEDKIGQLFELGFNPYNLKLITKSYTSSKCAMTGISIDCGHFLIMIGPQNNKTWRLPKLKKDALEFLGINPHAVTALAREYIDSKVSKQGLNTLIDDVVVMIGPQTKNTMKVR